MLAAYHELKAFPAEFSIALAIHNCQHIDNTLRNIKRIGRKPNYDRVDIFST
jgi:hypothetical protein